MLPDRSILKGQKLIENAKIKKVKWYILSGQKFIKNAKIVDFASFLKTLRFDNRTKMVENAKIQMRHFL